jgi:nicotinate dehydrogenase subunit B
MSSTLVVNGVAHTVESRGDRALLTVLRDDLGITGAKFGCGEGRCGACVVQVGDEVLPACRTELREVGARPITTVEGLAQSGRLHAVQRAWLEVGALQCGFCTPGWLVETAALIERRPQPSEAEILASLERHLCRCCTYPRIRRAVRRALQLAGSAGGPRDPVASDDASENDGRRRGQNDTDWRWPDRGPTALEPERGARGHDAQAPLEGTVDGGLSLLDALGEGILSVFDPPASRRGWGAPTGAWVHAGVDGSVTAGIGKVEGGQGTRTALSLLVADELRVPFTSVRLLMGDTAVSPFDMGTFGSRSMPDAGPALSAAAAALREALREAAANRMGIAARSITLQGMEAVSRDPDRRLRWAELLVGVRRVLQAAADPPMTPEASGRPAGGRINEENAGEAVRGAKLFPSDLSRPQMLYGAVLRAPAYGARLRSLDSRRAQAMAGVSVVRDADEFVGVVADDPDTARCALAALDATWELTEQPSRAEIQSYLRSHPGDRVGWSGPVLEQRGDPNAALRAAATRLETTYLTAYIAHVPMEPRAALAEWKDGRVTVWTGTQLPFPVRSSIAEALGLDAGDVRVIVPDFGGGFGGKHGATVALEAARLARFTEGRAVKVQWSRAEEFTWGHLRPAAVIDVAAALRGDGHLEAWSMTNVNSGAAALFTPYAVPHWRVAYQPCASPLPQGSYRALAATANHFARESHMDELARRIGADPLEFRVRHLRDPRIVDVLHAAAQRVGWGDPPPATPGYGRGIAGGVEKDGRVATAAEVLVEPDRRLRLLRLVTAFDCGAVVNPDNLANQIEGAAVMGLGGALFELIDFADGRLLNASLASYRVPRLSDVPEVEVVLLDRPDQPSAGGGETPIVAIAPAIANAVANACGVRLTTMPLVPDGTVPVA